MPGTLNIRPLQANLTRNTEIFSKMDPYFVITVGDHKINGPICPKGGLHPHWEQPVTLKKTSEKSCNIEIKNKNRIVADDSVASCNIDISDIEAKGHTTQWYPATFQGNPAGKVLVEVVFNAEKIDKNQFLPQPGHFVPTPSQPRPDIFYPVNEPRPEEKIVHPGHEVNQHQNPNVFYPAPNVQFQPYNITFGNQKYPDLGTPYNPYNQFPSQPNYAPVYPPHKHEEPNKAAPSYPPHKHQEPNKAAPSYPPHKHEPKNVEPSYPPHQHEGPKKESTSEPKLYRVGRRGNAQFPNPNMQIRETKVIGMTAPCGKLCIGRRYV